MRHRPGHQHPRAVVDLRQARRGHHPEAVKVGAQELGRETVRGHPGGPHVGGRQFEGAHARQRRTARRQPHPGQPIRPLGGRRPGHPQRLAPGDLETLQGTGRGQRLRLRRGELHPVGQIGQGAKRASCPAFGHQPFGHLLPDVADPRQPEAHRCTAVFAVGMAPADVHTGPVHHHAVAPRVGHQRLRRVEPHRLGAQQRGAERRRMVQLEPRRVEHQRRERQCVALRKTVVGEGLHLLVDPVGHRPGDAVPLTHAGVEPGAQPAHLLGGAFRPHRPAQLVGLGGTEPGTVDGQLHQLFLKQRHPQGFPQRGTHRRVIVGDRVDAVAATDVGVHRAALDGAGTDQRHLHHQVVEDPGPQPRQGGHLGAGLHLEHPDTVGAGQHGVHRRLGQVDLGEIHFDAGVFGDQVLGVVQCRQHAQAEQIELDQPDRRAVVLVPLQNSAAGHTRPLHRADIGDGAITDHHATGVDPQMPGQPGDLGGQLDHRSGNPLNTGVAALQPAPAADPLAPGVLLPWGEPQGAGGVAHRTAPPVGDDVGDLGGMGTPVPVVDVLDDLFTPIRFDVDVDVGGPVADR